MENIVVEQAVKAMNRGFKCMPMPELRDKNHQFDQDTLKMVNAAGYKLKWLDTFQGGCWHVVTKR